MIAAPSDGRRGRVRPLPSRGMGPLIWENRPERLRNPVVVSAFTGWNDAGDAASAALRYFGAAVDAYRVAHVDPEEFYDFQETRPRVEISDGAAREVCWPTVEIHAAELPGAPGDLLLVSGPEPNYRWRSFSQIVVGLAHEYQARMVVSMGALLADVPHSRPVAISGMASDPTLIDRIGALSTNYEGPTGITGVVHAACHDADLPSASLWASVPHYVAAAPNPKAALALVQRLALLVGIEIDVAELEDASADYERQVSLAVQSDDDVREFVERLERAAELEDAELELDQGSLEDPLQLPDGEVIAKEFQRFLRQQGPE